MDTLILTNAMLFLSTLSLRRATYWSCVPVVGRAISIHALLAESDARRASRQQPAGISIHALLAESDGGGHISKARSENFYPRSPCGERRDQEASNQTERQISIHALLAESDENLS